MALEAAAGEVIPECRLGRWSRGSAEDVPVVAWSAVVFTSKPTG